MSVSTITTDELVWAVDLTWRYCRRFQSDVFGVGRFEPPLAEDELHEALKAVKTVLTVNADGITPYFDPRFRSDPRWYKAVKRMVKFFLDVPWATYVMTLEQVRDKTVPQPPPSPGVAICTPNERENTDN